ncbi:hypothetical protein ALO70_200092 [Pseudomonas amygdali pv. eriobotryae]|uniref:Uncharacterized protein n=1 Tax=Pseudomonas amygdali pv. eriobotryae TaxID=129137 RepID=A0A0P9U6I0_PSEA0|nr:hypothetical protein [Pseudomonas amygdali]KPX20979.1 hypothetical protein ALO70_200092 [Pseudomonas amygdali pv. eriobotryae]RMM02423.1 hypothetical protein ALQ86_03697 [Pseudomonas amygdali pv. eriobotryae]RMO62554.1 hypothetical protein ALQ39_00967 [Pseudomonas amygdali pv. eriobotryae]GFZ73907.1 hypothetical protein PSE10C_46490 [Pseudomonas amygdali pv. eriobotryae]
MSKVERCPAFETVGIPLEVLEAQQVQWDVLIDAYLTQAARVGTRYAASVFLDRAGLIADGTTVATPEVKAVEERQGFVLLQSVCGNDYYVIANWLASSEHLHACS